MKFSCEKSALQSAAAAAARAAAVRSSVPSLEGLLIEAFSDVRISGYDLKTGICTTVRADVIEEGSVVLNAKLFGDIIRKMPDDVLTVSVDAKLNAHISCGMSEFNILGINSSDYPEMPSADGQTSIYIKESVLKDMIAQTNFAVSENEARPIHTGSLFELEDGVLTVVSVDGYRLALRREKVERSDIAESKFVVPGTALSEVEKLAGDSDELIRITHGSKHINFTIGSTVLVSRRLEGEFLNYRSAVPLDGKITVGIDRRAFTDSVERVSLIINDRLKSPVRCIFADGTLKITAATALGKASDECAIEGDGGNLEIGFNNRFLLDALRAAPSDELTVMLNSGVSPCVIVPKSGERNFIYMILPVRLRANEG